MFRRVCICALVMLAPRLAEATYSPPLTRVRIDADRTLHTPSVLYASERKTTPATDVELKAWGAQYLGQFEFDSGFGLQIGAAAGLANVDGAVGGREAFTVDTDGVWLGGQLRAYQMVWSSTVAEGERPSALTAFVNLRTLYYDTRGTERGGGDADLSLFTLTGGIGLMAELSVSDYVSICPYAWLTPGVTARLDYTIRDQDFSVDGGFTLRNPLLVGVDVWVYLFPPNWEDHLSLSLLLSLLDTQGDDRTVATVIGYTF
ncbi:MAG: hypothetical protein RIT81_21095 [Deltaproteobacteria bacterium]